MAQRPSCFYIINDHNLTFKKRGEGPPSKHILNLGKAESSSPLAIYKPHHEKTLFLHMPKGADKLCNYTGGSEPIFLYCTD